MFAHSADLLFITHKYSQQNSLAAYGTAFSPVVHRPRCNMNALLESAFLLVLLASMCESFVCILMTPSDLRASRARQCAGSRLYSNRICNCCVSFQQCHARQWCERTDLGCSPTMSSPCRLFLTNLPLTHHTHPNRSTNLFQSFIY